MKNADLRISALFAATLLVTGFCLSACDSVWVSVCTLSTPVPELNTVSPTTIDTHALPVTMTVTGSDFQTWSQIHWGSTTLPTTYVDSQHLSSVITQDTLASVNINSGTGTISVFTEGQGSAVKNCANGGSSSTITIIIN